MATPNAPHPTGAAASFPAGSSAFAVTSSNPPSGACAGGRPTLAASSSACVGSEQGFATVLTGTRSSGGGKGNIVPSAVVSAAQRPEAPVDRFDPPDPTADPPLVLTEEQVWRCRIALQVFERKLTQPDVILQEFKSLPAVGSSVALEPALKGKGPVELVFKLAQNILFRSGGGER